MNVFSRRAENRIVRRVPLQLSEEAAGKVVRDGHKPPITDGEHFDGMVAAPD